MRSLIRYACVRRAADKQTAPRRWNSYVNEQLSACNNRPSSSTQRSVENGVVLRARRPRESDRDASPPLLLHNAAFRVYSAVSSTLRHVTAAKRHSSTQLMANGRFCLRLRA